MSKELTSWNPHLKRNRVVNMDKYNITYDDGSTLIDCQAGNFVFMWGYSQHQIADAIAEQLKKFPFVRGNRNETYEQSESTLAKFCELSGMHCGSWVLSGSGANEAMIHMADLYNDQSKDKIVGLAPGFFGTMHLPRTIQGMPKNQWTSFPSERVIVTDNPMWLDIKDRDAAEGSSLDKIETIFKRGDIGILMMESFTWMTGFLEYSDNWWRTVRSLCDQYEVLMCVDDVAMSFMRGSDQYFYHNSKGVQPDIVTTGKAISNGYSPISVVLGSEKVYKKIRHTPWTFGHVWQPNVAGIVAINEVFKLIDKGLNLSYHKKKLSEIGDLLVDQGYAVRYRQPGMFLSVDTEIAFNDTDYLNSGLLINSSSTIDHLYKKERPTLRMTTMQISDDQFYNDVTDRLLDLFERKLYGKTL